ncbi:hypothetical protein COV93_05315 [Candidatus Woesearchaeota archaeon CG11_big_fil_rev_8_21_14_0_20_43_8]|nr:MAG: hypothetical protein COV93_05315 [Candidatus Woesearchaeota archaeon CG11_big_fil_rev_8_21_14_0_20_43_8]PIO07066.1 MAG: hypothetical protein COT47_01665 [Candidatus Woesearchaeota archaeon CG08_land_8_20_14_0_20_43_7]
MSSNLRDKIVTDPKNIEEWLVYADRLCEMGDPMGEYIQLSHGAIAHDRDYNFARKCNLERLQHKAIDDFYMRFCFRYVKFGDFDDGFFSEASVALRHYSLQELNKEWLMRGVVQLRLFMGSDVILYVASRPDMISLSETVEMISDHMPSSVKSLKIYNVNITNRCLLNLVNKNWSKGISQIKFLESTAVEDLIDEINGWNIVRINYIDGYVFELDKGKK